MKTNKQHIDQLKDLIEKEFGEAKAYDTDGSFNNMWLKNVIYQIAEKYAEMKIEEAIQLSKDTYNEIARISTNDEHVKSIGFYESNFRYKLKRLLKQNGNTKDSS